MDVSCSPGHQHRVVTGNARRVGEARLPQSPPPSSFVQDLKHATLLNKQRSSARSQRRQYRQQASQQEGDSLAWDRNLSPRARGLSTPEVAKSSRGSKDKAAKAARDQFKNLVTNPTPLGKALPKVSRMAYLPRAHSPPAGFSRRQTARPTAQPSAKPISSSVTPGLARQAQAATVSVATGSTRQLRRPQPKTGKSSKWSAKRAGYGRKKKSGTTRGRTRGHAASSSLKSNTRGAGSVRGTPAPATGIISFKSIQLALKIQKQNLMKKNDPQRLASALPSDSGAEFEGYEQNFSPVRGNTRTLKKQSNDTSSKNTQDDQGNHKSSAGASNPRSRSDNRPKNGIGARSASVTAEPPHTQDRTVARLTPEEAQYYNDLINAKLQARKEKRNHPSPGNRHKRESKEEISLNWSSSSYEDKPEITDVFEKQLEVTVEQHHREHDLSLTSSSLEEQVSSDQTAPVETSHDHESRSGGEPVDHVKLEVEAQEDSERELFEDIDPLILEKLGSSLCVSFDDDEMLTM